MGKKDNVEWNAVYMTRTPRTKELETILQQLNDWIKKWKVYEKRKEIKSVTVTISKSAPTP